MKDVFTPLRELFTAIFEAKNYTSYENGAVPDEAETPYIIITSMDDTENSDKTNFGHAILTTFDLVTSYPKNKIGSSKEVDLMASNVLSEINSKTKLDLGEDLQIINTKLIRDQKLGSKTQTKTIFRRLLTYQQLIKEV